MKHKYDWKVKNKNDELFRSSGFWWKVDSDLGDSYLEIRGPFCLRKGCLFQLKVADKKIICEKCGEEYEHRELEYLIDFARRDYIANRNKTLPAKNFDKLPSINEELVENDKFYRVSIEHSEKGGLTDVHIIIGKKQNKGKKAHIIISHNGEIRFDKKDLSPEEEIKSITSIIYK